MLSIIEAVDVGKTTLPAAIMRLTPERLYGNPPGTDTDDDRCTDPGADSRMYVSTAKYYYRIPNYRYKSAISLKRIMELKNE